MCGLYCIIQFLVEKKKKKKTSILYRAKVNIELFTPHSGTDIQNLVATVKLVFGSF